MTQPIQILVNGAHGKMGQEVCKAITATQDLKLYAGLEKDDNLADFLSQNQVDVVIDFTAPQAVFNNVKTILQANVHPVIGTTGLTPQQMNELEEIALAKKIGGIIAPNFSIGAVLMMHFAQIANRFLPFAEIIEMHHEKKLDAPSGTALKTAHHMTNAKLATDKNTEKSRGLIQNHIPIHSVRLPGFVAHQEVILSGDKELLTIRHDSLDRTCFMPGVLLACRKVIALKHIVIGLESLLNLNSGF